MGRGRQATTEVFAMVADQHFATVLRRGGHAYVFLWAADRMEEACATAGRWAADPELPLTWHEAALIVASIRASRGPQTARHGG